ncbi:DUF1905 domain-containing protein [Actinoplanes sp. NPDC051494]|uniref:DUF1905 domain-containing protein n=1 Tax=Actinoplanes sp. NPDC051494 TaxID=3363907 RepID=UPI0037981C68
MIPITAGTRFRAELRRGAGGSFGFAVPLDVIVQLGVGRPGVVVTVNGYSFRTTIVRTPRGHWLRVTPWRRIAARITTGRHHDIDIELNLPRRATMGS